MPNKKNRTRTEQKIEKKEQEKEEKRMKNNAKTILNLYKNVLKPVSICFCLHIAQELFCLYIARIEYNICFDYIFVLDQFF